MSTVELQTYTPDDLLQMPDGERYELVDGQLVEIDLGAESSWVGGRIFKFLALYEEQRGGWAFPGDTSFQCFPLAPEMVRRPDAAFVCAGRFEHGQVPQGHIPIAPDLAVEVVSPNDMYTRVEDKVEEYLQAGVRLVWVLNPANRTVRIFKESIEGSTQAGPNDELTGGDVLPDFRCRIADLFPPSQS